MMLAAVPAAHAISLIVAFVVLMTLLAVVIDHLSRRVDQREADFTRELRDGEIPTLGGARRDGPKHLGRYRPPT